MSERHKPEAVILDFYGVIRNDIQAAWLEKHGLERTGIFAAASDALDAGKITIEEYLQRYSAESGFSPEAIASEFEATPMVEGMHDLLRALHSAQQAPLGLLSNADSGPRAYLEQNNLLELFKDVTISSEVGLRKPEKRIYEHSLAKMGVRACDAMFFDDSMTNVTAAARLGMRAYHFTTAQSAREILSREGLLIA